VRLDTGEAWERLSGAAVGHLATADRAGTPHVVPAVFAVAGDQLYIAVDAKPKRGGELRRVRNLRGNPKATFLADHYDPEDWSKLWWVRADGDARVIDDPAAMRGPIDLLAAKYPQYRAERPPGPVIAITVTRITGWSGAGCHVHHHDGPIAQWTYLPRRSWAEPMPRGVARV
jgi:PPOX class probable F420-dependent enzyme